MGKLKLGEGGYVFISHSHNDIVEVRKLRNIMERQGFEPLCFFLKCLDDNAELEDLIKREIDSRDWFVYADSKNARDSEWVRKERAYIERQNCNKIINIDLDSGVQLQEFSRKLMNCLRVFLLYSASDEGAAALLQESLKKSDYRVYMLNIDNEDVEDHIEDYSHAGCVILMISEGSSQPMNAMIKELRSKKACALIAFIREAITQRGKEAYGIRESGFDNAEINDMSWVYLDREPTQIQIERTIDCVDDMLFNKYNEIEDSVKLDTHFEHLKEIYSGESFVNAGNTDVDPLYSERCIPVVKIADLDGKRIEIKDNSRKFYSPPPFVKKHREELLEAHRSSEIYDNVNIRVKDWYIDDDSFVIVTERTKYFDSLVTNRAMDYRLETGDTVREQLEPGSSLTSLVRSRLSNHLGFNGMVESSNGWFFFVFRKKNLSIAKKTYGNSINASLKTKYALNGADDSFAPDGLYRAIREEIRDEVGIGVEEFLEPDEIDAERRCTPVIVCAYRDLLEGGKPQLFFYYRSSLTKKRISECFAKNNERSRKAGRYEPQRDRSIRAVMTDGDRLFWISREDILNDEKTKVCIDRIELSERDDNGDSRAVSLPMYPTSSACVVFLKEYLLKKQKEEAEEHEND